MHKRILFLLTVLLTGLQSFIIPSDALQKINFEDKSFSAVCHQAKAEHKLVFVLIESKYCSVCQKMDKDLTKGGEYSRVFNDNFCCLKMYADDALKQIKAGNWGVTKVPTLLFMNDKGKVFHVAEGYNDPRTFAAEADIALNEAASADE